MSENFVKNFPFPTKHERQSYVLNEIATAFDSEAPTGFGKSPVAIAVALTLDTSYICTSTKDLQTQYPKDFRFLKIAKGKNNFIQHRVRRSIHTPTTADKKFAIFMLTCDPSTTAKGPPSCFDLRIVGNSLFIILYDIVAHGSRGCIS